MKIKEKGIKGAAATARRESNRSNVGNNTKRGFNAFKEMGKQSKQAGKDKPKPEVYLEFLGTRIRVHEEDGGRVKPEDVPAVRGAALRFEGAGEDVSFDGIKVRFARWLLATLYLVGHRVLTDRSDRAR